MKQIMDLAIQFLSLTSKKRYTVFFLSEATLVAVKTIVFHAKHAVERQFKTMSFLYGTTHAVYELLDSLKVNKRPVPRSEEQLGYLTSNTVLCRYKSGLSEPAPH